MRKTLEELREEYLDAWSELRADGPGSKHKRAHDYIDALESEIERLEAKRVDDMRAAWEEADGEYLCFKDWLAWYDKGQK